ncbi:MAG: glutathione S-transferase family protein [Myxococcota bacterium]
MLKVHGVNLSPFVRKVRVALAEKGIEYELDPVVPFNLPEEFLRISPLGKIPVLREGDFTLPDSSVILSYLEQTHPEVPLYPSDPRERARALFLEEYADTRLVESALPVFRERVVHRRFLKRDCDEDAVQKALSKSLPPVFDYLESQVTSDEDGIVGGRFSVADLAIASPFVNLMEGGERVDAKRWPRLASYLERIHARPSFKELIAEEATSLA